MVDICVANGIINQLIGNVIIPIDAQTDIFFRRVGFSTTNQTLNDWRNSWVSGSQWIACCKSSPETRSEGLHGITWFFPQQVPSNPTEQNEQTRILATLRESNMACRKIDHLWVMFILNLHWVRGFSNLCLTTYERLWIIYIYIHINDGWLVLCSLYILYIPYIFLYTHILFIYSLYIL